MPVTVTPVLAGITTHVSDIEASADGDTNATIPHGLGAVPAVMLVTGLNQAVAALSAWAVLTWDATNVVLNKSTAAGSGALGNQVRATIMLPHSLIS